MKYISLNEENIHKLSFYLAMEEYVAKNLDVEEAFFLWRVNPSVIFGRNQLIEKEVNLSYCNEHNIATFRRKSGGGCVYADRGNIMISYITREYNVADAYNAYLSKVVDLLNTMGVKAEASGRNDILVNGMKVSGNAFYRCAGKSIVHGTLLYDTDMENMINAITPTTQKLKSKGVESVRSRITTLKNHISITIEELLVALKNGLSEEVVELCEEDELQIREIEKTYLTDDFIYGNNPRCNIEREMRIEGVGEFRVMLETNKGVINHINLVGDYFIKEEFDEQLLNRLKNVAYNENAIREALADVNVSDYILNLDNENFVKLLILNKNGN